MNNRPGKETYGFFIPHPDDASLQGLDLEMDHIAILTPDKSGVVIDLVDDLIHPLNNVDFLCSIGASSCILVCAEASYHEKKIKGIAHVSTVFSLTEIMERIHSEMAKYLNIREHQLSANYFLFGGTENSMQAFLESDDNAICSPDDCSYADETSRLLNPDDDETDIAVFMNNDHMLIYQNNEQITKVYKQTYRPEDSMQHIQTKRRKDAKSLSSQSTFKQDSAAKDDEADSDTPKRTL